MSVINTNVSSLVAQNSLTMNKKTLDTTMERLSTGLRVNGAKDDAAGLAISTRMDSQIRGLTTAIRNANDGAALIQTAEGAMEEVTNMLQRMRELSVQSANAVNNAQDRRSLDAEVQQLKAEIDRVAQTTQFNGINLLDGSFKNQTLQIGNNANQTLDINIGSIKTNSLGFGASTFGVDVLVGDRVRLDNLFFGKGDIQINGQQLDAFNGTNAAANATAVGLPTAKVSQDLGDLVRNINENVDNVQASAFNIAVAKSRGDGVTAEGEMIITVTPLKTGDTATTATTFRISQSNSMDELVANINSQTQGMVQASVNDEGKLVLQNETGATIKVADKRSSGEDNYDTGSGFKGTTSANAIEYRGFLKLESTDGSAIRIEKGNMFASLSAGTLSGTGGTNGKLNAIGFTEISKTSLTDGYTVTGKALTSAGANTAWNKTDLTINGVEIFDVGIDTSTFGGKLAAINAFSEETGVVAQAFFDKTFDMTSAYASSAFSGSVRINGTALSARATTSAAGLRDAINNAKIGLTATLQGNVLRLTGNVQTVSVTTTSAGAGFTAASFLGTTRAATAVASSGLQYGGIRLDSLNNSPISIRLGELADGNKLSGSAGSITELGRHGFVQMNVGAADYDVNSATIGTGGASTLEGLNILSVTSSVKALGVIDNALSRVSDIRSELGAIENRLQSTVNNLSNVVTNTAAAQSRIMDTDYAAETTKLARSQIIQQAATAMLAQANQQPSSVLALLQ